MSKLLLLTLAAGAYAQSTCDICTEIVNVFDDLDPTSIAEEICPLVDNGLCEDVLPHIIQWIQGEWDSETICQEWCSSQIDINVARKFGHHVFDLPHPTEPEIISIDQNDSSSN